MARVRCVMMQRDEDLLLEAWFKYYGYLFGFENLTVFDNGSTNPVVIETLKKYVRVGATVRWEFDRVEDFHAKGAHFRNIMHHWDNLGEYDFALPVDCDEFLGVLSDQGIECARSSIHARLDALIGDPRPLQISYSLFNVPGLPGAFAPMHYQKRFLGAGLVEEVDHGFHALTSRATTEVLETDFVYMHMHGKPFNVLLEQARRKLERFVDVDDRETLRNFTGPGVHLVKYFFMNEEEYRRSFEENRLVLLVPGFDNLISALGVDSPIFRIHRDYDAFPKEQVFVVSGRDADGRRIATPFLGQHYLNLNKDVAAAGWPPLRHYVMAGHKEERKFALEQGDIK